MSSKSPPVVDFGDFLSGEPDRMQKCAQAIGDACRTQGFFQIVNHPIPASLQKEMMRLSKDFFALPLEEKMKLDKAQNQHNRGYEVMYGQMIENRTKPDLKEGFYVAQDLAPDHPQVLSQKFAHGPNLWPESLGPHFRDTCMDYLNSITALTEQVMQAIALSLGYEQNYFDEFCTDPMAFYKLLHYPPQAEDSHPLQRGIGAHRDFGVITLLLQGDVPGLEVWDEEAQAYYPAPPVEGAYVVNLGNLFERWSNDVYISNVHRVINHSGTDRYSILRRGRAAKGQMPDISGLCLNMPEFCLISDWQKLKYLNYYDTGLNKQSMKNEAIPTIQIPAYTPFWALELLRPSKSLC